MHEAELIEIIEGPTPEFRPDIQLWNWGIYQGMQESEVGYVELRTNNGDDIRARSRAAWDEGRPVRLDFPGEFGIREQVDVVSLRLKPVDEGTVLQLWVYLPVDDREEVADEDDDLGFA